MRGLLLLLSFLWLSTAASQDIITVTDNSGKPLEGVSIFSRDYTIQMVTNADGEATLAEDAEPSDVLYFVMLGYNELKLTVAEVREMGFAVVMEGGLQLDEILIVGRTHDESRNMVNQVAQIKSEEISLFNPQTTADALAASGQVFVQKSQMGGGSPILRGFEANKVLLVVDGIRLNNAIYRNGHLQNAITLDGAVLENISVIFGPGSLMYGSDAIGGVMHFLTRTPKLRFGDDKRWDGNLYSRISSANEGKTFHADIETGSKRFASLTSVTYSDFNDLRSGGNRSDRYPDFGKRLEYVVREANNDRIVPNEDPDIQVGTGYQQLDLMQKFLFQLDKNRKVVFNLQYSTSSDVPRYDALTEYDGSILNWAEWDYGPQKRWLAATSYFDSRDRGWYNYLTTTISYQKIIETRKTRIFMDDIREIQDEEVDILGITVDLEKSLGRLSLNYGIDVNVNYVNSEAFGIHITNDALERDILTRYPSGDNTMTSLAAYLSGIYDLNDNHRLLSGMRWTRTNLSFNYLRSDNIEWPPYFYDGISGSNNALTWSAGVTSRFSDRLSVQAMVATAFRSPNLDDVAKIRRKIDEVTVPNPDLGPEKSLSADLTINWSPSSRIKFRGTGFYTRLTDAVVRSDFSLPDGSRIIIDRGDTLNVVSNINAENAKVYGISTGVEALLSNDLTVEGTYSWTRGRVTSTEAQPLAHIPPSYGMFQLSYKGQGISSSFNIRYNLKKDINEYGGSEDNPELATPEGALGWATFNLYNKLHISDRLILDMAVENMFDVHYRPFASGVSAPGRNFVTTIRFSF